MSQFRNIQRATVEFTNRDGVPTALIVDEFPEGSYAEINTSEDGTKVDILVYSAGIQNGRDYRFKGMDDEELVWRPKGVPLVTGYAVAENGRGVKKTDELGPVGKAVLSVVGLAILTPFVGILWAWAMGVVRGMGGAW